MKKALIFFLLANLLFNCNRQKEESADSESDVERKLEIASPRKKTTGSVNGVNVTIDYGSPAVNGRKIWGELEKYGKVWRAGANATTSISIDQDIIIGGESLAAGKYAFFIIPDEKEWTIIFNRDWDEWGAYNYDSSQDVLRFTTLPEWREEDQERLNYSISDEALTFSWEKVRITLDILQDS